MATKSPADLPKGLEVRFRRRREHNDKHFPRMLSLWRQGLTLPEIAADLNKDSLNCDGRPWTSATVQRILIDRMDPAEYAALARARMTRGNANKTKRTRTHDEAVLPRVVELLKDRLSQWQVAERLQAEGYTNSAGSPWNQRHVSALLHRRLPSTEVAALAARGHRAGAAIRRRGTRRHDEAVLPRILELRQADLSQAQIADRLNEEAGHDVARLNSAGRPWRESNIHHVLRRSHGGAALGQPPVILGNPGQPVQVLGVDGRYREKQLGGGRNGKSRRFVVEALLKAGPGGLSVAELVAIAPGARSVIKTFLEDRYWAAVIYQPDKPAGIGWRIGPPRPING